MVSYVARTRPWGPSLHSVLIMTVIMSLFRPAVLLAAPTAQPDLAAFDRGFRKGQDEFNRQKYLDAARVWTATAGQLPETEEHKENRRAIYEYIAEAYEKALDGAADDALMREGLSVLDTYAEVFTAAYPANTLPEKVTRARLSFRTQLANRAAEQLKPKNAQEQPTSAPSPTSREPVRSPRKPWKGLAIGGGIAVAGGTAMLGMFAAGLAGAKSAESKFDDPANDCDLNNPVGECADINSKGRTANAIGLVGLVASPILLGAGITMLVVALRRKKSSNVIAPVFSPSMAGMVLQQRF